MKARFRQKNMPINVATLCRIRCCTKNEVFGVLPVTYQNYVLIGAIFVFERFHHKLHDQWSEVQRIWSKIFDLSVNCEQHAKKCAEICCIVASLNCFERFRLTLEIQR